MKKAAFLSLTLCFIATVGALVWITQMDEEEVPGSDWEQGEMPASTANAENSSSQAPQRTPSILDREPRPGERVEVEQPAERDPSKEISLAEVKALVKSGEAPNELLALELLRDMDPEQAWPVLNELLGSQSAQVRAESVELASEFDDDNTAAFLTRAVIDSSVFVGYTVLEKVEELPRREREQVWRAAVLEAPADVGAAVLGDMEVESNHNSVDIIIEGLNSQVEDTREESREILDFIFDQRFDSATAASKWWQENRSKYDRDLVEKE